MSTILDQNQRPIQSSENGQNKESSKVDVRTIPTGTLIYNLIRYTGEEIGIANTIHQIEAIKEQQKMVNDPPQLAAMRDHEKHVQAWRYLISVELNERFADIDNARLAGLSLSVVDLTKSAEPGPQSGS
jgi:hypothetical protein